ncbi:hypothetical protein V1290_000085 [Bradyrhizobium sp. AZCC 1578]|uniref:hypothetical protein n=1 Tax=Bradyrhizobium sp. AZCC 1578 TaxID=3117027 RepID=UPI002FF15DBA
MMLLGRCRRLGHCGFIHCVCDVDPTDPRDMAKLRNEENMSELESIIDDVGNQVAERQTGCLSMRSERLLVDEIKALRTKAEYWRLLAERNGTENWQLNQACGYPIPADKETPQNPFKCGICDARARCEICDPAGIQ